MDSPVMVDPPTAIRLKRSRKEVEVVWADGRVDHLSGFSLRRACACAACTHASRTGRLTLIDADVGIDRVEAFGVSGLQFHFSDGHSRGLYPWRYLRELGGRLS